MSRILYSGENQITNSYRVRVHEAVDVVKKWYQADTVIAHSDGVVVLVQTGRKTSLGSTGNASYGNFVKILHPLNIVIYFYRGDFIWNNIMY